MVVPETADDFRAAVSAFRSLDVSKGVSFHTFSLPEDRCARLLIKNLGRRIARGRRPRGAGVPWHLCSRDHAVSLGAPRPEPRE